MSPKIPIDILLGLDLGKSHHHACALKLGRHKGFRQAASPTQIRVSSTLR